MLLGLVEKRFQNKTDDEVVSILEQIFQAQVAVRDQDSADRNNY
jgi:hypothetical protein